jgi:ABC-2 type transport system ATP-binding protein
MDDIEALCSEVTIIATGRVAFTGPLSKLSAENRELDYRLRTSDPDAARRLTLDTPGLRILDSAHTMARQNAEELVVRAPVPVLDALVARLARADIAVRELTPVVSPLEAAFLALTEQQEAGR